MEEGKYIETDKGTPQGGVLSPLLANIYLHYVLDLWFEKRVKKQLKGYAQLIRYADDFIVCFERSNEAQAFGEELRGRVGKFGLSIAEDKSKIIEFGRRAWQKARQGGKKVQTFDFLGITHYCGTTRKGAFKLGYKTAKTRLRQKAKAMNQWLRRVRNQVELEQWWTTLRQKLEGHYRYYGISGNIHALNQYYYLTKQLANKWINRRSQRRSYTYEQYKRYVQYNPLPKPKIYRSLYTLSTK